MENLRPVDDWRSQLDPYLAFHSTPIQLARIASSGFTLEDVLAQRPIHEGCMRHHTGLWNDLPRLPTLAAARMICSKLRIPLCYVEWDVKNLGGANKILGKQLANEQVLRPMAEIIVRRFGEAMQREGRACVQFFHGGDELATIALGFEPLQTLTDLLHQIVEESRAYSIRHGFAELPHPKHPEDPLACGIGLAYGYSEFRRTPSGSWMTERDMFIEADVRVEGYKEGGGAQWEVVPAAPPPS